MKILLALNSFKGSILSLEANRTFEQGLQAHFPKKNITVFPICDGGDGSIDSLSFHLNIDKVRVKTCDVTGAKIYSEYLYDPIKKTAYIELASTSGMARIDVKKNNVVRSNTYGTGLLVQDAISKKAKKIILLTGGSATNDAGLGILGAIGIKFKDKNHNSLAPIPSNLVLIQSIDDQVVNKLKQIKFEIWTDVTNPFTGLSGAVAVYSKQKGANKKDRALLEKGMIHFRDLVRSKYNLDLDQVPGSGSAGGVSGGMAAIVKASIVHGTDAIMRLTRFEKKLTSHDLVFTGEGRLDDQSGYGKLVHGINSLAAKHHIPVIGICGGSNLDTANMRDLGFAGIYTIVPGPVSLQDAMVHSKAYLQQLGYSIGATITALRP